MALISDILFTFISRLFLIWFGTLKSFYLKKSVESVKSVLALPYYPEELPGAWERMGIWKEKLEESGMRYDIHFAAGLDEFLVYRDSKSNIKKYPVYFKTLFRRLKIISQLKQYDTIWLQRSFIPYYPFKDAFFERLINKLHPNVIIDFYDADYVYNPELVNNAAMKSKAVTVSSDHLKEHFLKFNKNVLKLNMTLDETRYRTGKKEDEPIRIGWMGKAMNFSYLEEIDPVFARIKNEHPGISIEIVVAKSKKLKTKEITYHHWDDEGFDYYNWLSKIDIGLVPLPPLSDIEKAKSPMKTLEFMASNVAIVGNQNAFYPGMKDREHCLIVENMGAWEKAIKKLIENKSLREKISSNALSFFKENHSLEANLDHASEILTSV